MTILIVDNYDSFTFNLYQLLQEQTAEEVLVRRNDALDLQGIRDLNPSKIVLSPGPGHPANEKDFGVCGQVITAALQLKAHILGICLGHQGMAQHLGGSVVRAPEIIHGKTSTITVTGKSPIFEGLPSRFQAMRYHSLVAQETDLPDSLVITAREENMNLIMAMQHKELPMYGLQFHPESIGTPEGKRMLRNFLEL